MVDLAFTGIEPIGAAVNWVDGRIDRIRWLAIWNRMEKNKKHESVEHHKKMPCCSFLSIHTCDEQYGNLAYWQASYLGNSRSTLFFFVFASLFCKAKNSLGLGICPFTISYFAFGHQF